jgi:hypothetical protein
LGTTNQSIHRATVSMNLPKKNADLVLYGNNVVQKMTNNPVFPTPTPTLVALTLAVTDLHNAETAALSRAKGTATVRNGKRAVLVALLQQLRGYVQAVASYAWEYSLDGGKTWVAAPITTQGRTTIAGLPSGTTVQFRYLAVTPKGGQGNWSQPLSLLVK